MEDSNLFSEEYETILITFKKNDSSISFSYISHLAIWTRYSITKRKDEIVINFLDENEIQYLLSFIAEQVENITVYKERTITYKHEKSNEEPTNE